MEFKKAFDKYLSDRVFKWFLGCVCVLNILHTGTLLNHPFTGQNAWRDAQTYGVARNFNDEQGSYLEPKYDIRNTEDGRLPGEFPLQTWITMSFFKVFGTSIFIARITNFILGLCILTLLFLIFKKWSGKLHGILAMAIFSSNALAMSQTVSIMPETLVSLLFCLAFFWYLFIKNPYFKWMLVIISITLCTLVKPSGYLIILFFISHHYLRNFCRLNLKSGLLYASMVLIPILALFIWIKFTMQFEHPEFDYPITHHYVRTFQNFLFDLNEEVVLSALEKTFRHAFNVVGILGVGILVFRAFKKSIDKEENQFTISVLFWILGSIAFLIYAGIVQVNQLYYASPLIIPAILLVTKSLASNGILRFVIVLILLLQTNIKVNSFNANFFNDKEIWDDYRLENETDKWSERKDLFIVYPYHFPEFTMLGRLGRRGYNVETPEKLKAEIYYFKFICLVDTNRRNEILQFVNPKPISIKGHLEFYKIENHTYIK